MKLIVDNTAYGNEPQGRGDFETGLSDMSSRIGDIKKRPEPKRASGQHRDMFKNKQTDSTLSNNQQIGAILREERIARGLSCADIAQECKLQVVFVKAIEDGHTDYLPSHIYYRMFARMYADTVGIDPDQLLGKLYPELPPPEKPGYAGAGLRVQPVDADSNTVESTGVRVQAGAHPTYAPHPINPQTPDSATLRKRNVLRAGMAVAGVLALFVIAKYTVLNNGFASEETNAGDTTAVTDVATGANTTTDEAFTTGSNTETAFPAYQPREKLELTIKAKPSAKGAGVVVVADGDTLFNRKMRGGEVYTWNSNYRFKLDIADKDQVEVFIGGQRLKTSDVKGKRLRGLEITQLNFEQLLANPLSVVTDK